MKTLADLFQFIEVADEMALSMICWCCPISSENEIIYKISKPIMWEASKLLDSEDYKKYDVCQFRSNNSMWQNLIDSTMVVLDQEHRVCLISKLLERMNSIIKGGEAYDFVESSQIGSAHV